MGSGNIGRRIVFGGTDCDTTMGSVVALVGRCTVATSEIHVTSRTRIAAVAEWITIGVVGIDLLVDRLFVGNP